MGARSAGRGGDELEEAGLERAATRLDRVDVPARGDEPGHHGVIASTEVLGGLSDSVPVALFFAVFSLTGLGLATANYWALTQTLIPGGAIGRIVGIQNCAASIPGIVAPILTGWLVARTGNYAAPMQAIWAFLLIGVAAYVFLVRERYAPR